MKVFLQSIHMNTDDVRERDISDQLDISLRQLLLDPHFLDVVRHDINRSCELDRWWRVRFQLTNGLFKSFIPNKRAGDIVNSDHEILTARMGILDEILRNIRPRKNDMSSVAVMGDISDIRVDTTDRVIADTNAYYLGATP